MNACKNFSDGMAVKAGRDPMTITGMTITGRNKRVEDERITREIFGRTGPIKKTLYVFCSLKMPTKGRRQTFCATQIG
jgi:hypothetical protein